MLFAAPEQLEDKLIRHLAGSHAASAEALRARFSSYSIQAVYKALRKLQRQGVVVKNKFAYSLRLPWVLDMVTLGEQLNDYSTSPKDLINSFAQAPKTTWRFTSLLKLNDFWSQVLLALLQHSRSRTIYAWDPHTWFHLVQTAQEAQFIRSIKLAKSKLVLLVGSNSFLDRWAKQFWLPQVVESHFSIRHFASQQSTYINVIDDYVLTVKLADEATAKINNIYSNTTSMETLKLPEVIRFFSEPHRGAVYLEKNLTKAFAFTKKMQRIFGPLE